MRCAWFRSVSRDERDGYGAGRTARRVSCRRRKYAMFWLCVSTSGMRCSPASGMVCGLRLPKAAGWNSIWAILRASNERVAGRIIVSTTTNRNRAFRACVTAKRVAVASFLNLSATADWFAQQQTGQVILVCAGIAEFPALEDILAAGALCELLVSKHEPGELLDSAETAARVYREVEAGGAWRDQSFAEWPATDDQRRIARRRGVLFATRRVRIGGVARCGWHGPAFRANSLREF